MNNSRNKAEVILGVDTHLDTHVGVLLNAQGHQLGCLMVTTNISGYERLVTWANSFGCLTRAGVEGIGTYGAGLASVLRKHVSKSSTLIVLTAPNAGSRGNRILLMLKVQRDPFFPVVLPR